jgi:hypothetical protein
MEQPLTAVYAGGMRVCRRNAIHPPRFQGGHNSLASWPSCEKTASLLGFQPGHLVGHWQPCPDVTGARRRWRFPAYLSYLRAEGRLLSLARGGS